MRNSMVCLLKRSFPTPLQNSLWFPSNFSRTWEGHCEVRTAHRADQVPSSNPPDSLGLGMDLTTPEQVFGLEETKEF